MSRSHQTTVVRLAEHPVVLDILAYRCFPGYSSLVLDLRSDRSQVVDLGFPPGPFSGYLGDSTAGEVTITVELGGRDITNLIKVRFAVASDGSQYLGLEWPSSEPAAIRFAMRLGQTNDPQVVVIQPSTIEEE